MGLSRRDVLRSGVIGSVFGIAGCTSGDAEETTAATTTTTETTTTTTDTTTTTTDTTTTDTTTTETETETDTPACESPIHVSGTITEDTTWDCPQYRMTSDVTVASDATLTISKGVEVIAQEGVLLSVTDGGTLETAGEGTEPVWFHGEEKRPGYWRGIEITPGSVDSVLSGVTVAHGGADGWANVYLQTGASVSIVDSNLLASATYGLIAEQDATLPQWEANGYSDNALGLVRIPLTLLDSVDPDSAYGGGSSEHQRIEVYDQPLSTQSRWPNVDVPIYFATDATIRARVDVAPGANFEFAEGTRLRVEEGGVLNSTGESDNWITFSGTDFTTDGFWQGIEFVSNDRANRLEYTIVENGGAGDWANVYLQNGSQVGITNCQFFRSSTYGIHAEANTSFSTFANNEIRSAESGAMRIPLSNLASIDSASVFSEGPGTKRVEVFDEPVTEDATWSPLDVLVYFPEGGQIEAAVTVEPGTEFSFAEETLLTVDEGGSLRAVGTQDAEISFLPEDIGPRGFWEGIEFVSDDSRNELRNVLINGGGANGWANVYVQNGARVTIADSSLVASGTYGLHAEADTALPGFESNFFNLNEGGDMRLPASGLGQVDSMSTFSGDFEDTTGRIDVFADPVTEDATWAATRFTVHFTESVSVQAPVTVGVGNHYTFAQRTRLSVDEGGSLTAEGQRGDKITFEGDSDVRGFWQGIEFASLDSANRLEYCEVANGGADGWANVYVQSDGLANVRNCTLRDSLTYGVHIEEGAQATLFDNTFSGNAQGTTFQ